MNDKITFGNSYIESIEGIDYLRLEEESHYKAGFAAGTLFVKSNYKIIRLLKNSFIKIILLFLYLIYKNKMQTVRVPSEYQDELKGYSDAVKIPYKYLLLINLIYEIQGCSGFAFFNSSGPLLLGHNTDVSKMLSRLALRYIKPLINYVSIPGKNSFVHISLPLILGAINGFNDKGIAVSSHDAGGVYKKVVKNNTSTSCLVKMVLETANSLADVQKIAQNNLAYYPGIMIVASEREHKIGILEAYPTDFYLTVEKDRTYIFSTNHYQSDKMRKYHKEVKKGSLDRLACLTGSLSEKSNLSVQEAIGILQDHRNGFHRDTTGYSIANEGTFQSFIFDVTNRQVYISNGKKSPVSLYGNFVKVAAKP